MAVSPRSPFLMEQTKSVRTAVNRARLRSRTHWIRRRDITARHFRKQAQLIGCRRAAVATRLLAYRRETHFVVAGLRAGA